MSKTPWFFEFKAEIERDARELLVAKAQRTGVSPWSYNQAAASTRQFYLERISGYATCLSITLSERDELLALIALLWPESKEG